MRKMIKSGNLNKHIFPDYGFLRTWTNIKVVLILIHELFLVLLPVYISQKLQLRAFILGVPTTESITFCPYIKYGLCELETLHNNFNKQL